MKTLLAALLITTAATSAMARDFPMRDVEATCHAFADPVKENPALFQLCLDQEQGGYNRAKVYWSKLNENEQTECIRMAAQTEPYAYYEMLGEAVYVAYRVADNAGRFPRQFRY